MIGVETNLRLCELTNDRPALEIRFQFVDGSQGAFIQPDAEKAADVLKIINPAHLFYQSRDP